MELLLAQPRGFCAGVVRAVEIVERALGLYGAPIYVLHEIVHNQRVLAELSAKGAVFVETLDEIPVGSKTIFSAHGVSDQVVESARSRQLEIIDASCPLVTKVHLQSKQYEKEGHVVIVIGHQGHPEVEGICGNLKNHYVVDNTADIERLNVAADKTYAYVTQTTLSVDDTRELLKALKEKIPSIIGPDLKDICYATQNRQNAVKELARQSDLVLIIGAKNSSNSNRLKEVATAGGAPAFRIESIKELKPEWLINAERIGISAGASTPESLIEEVITALKEDHRVSVSIQQGIEETVQFRLPKEVTEQPKS